MRRHQHLYRFLLLPPAVALVAFLLAAPVAADWIKTREGALVETRGGWKVKGSIVVFTAANGTLSSLRLSEVDLDASAVATFESREKAKETEEALGPQIDVVREPVLVLTNQDIPRAGSVIEDQYEETDEGEPSGEASRVEPVKVVTWRPVESEDTGLEIRGALQNQGEHIASNLNLLVRLYDDAGELLGSANAFLDNNSLAPTSSLKFRALFPDVTESSVSPEFEVKSSAIQLKPVLVDTGEGDNES